MNTRSDWSTTIINFGVRVMTIAFYSTVLMFVFASLHKQFDIIKPMGLKESLAWGAAWSMVVALRRGK